MVEPTPWPKVPPEGAPRAVDIIADVLHAAFKGATDIDLDMLAAEAVDALQGEALTVELRWYDGDGITGEGVVILGRSADAGWHCRCGAKYSAGYLTCPDCGTARQ